MFKVIVFLIAIFCAGCGDCNREVSDVPYCGDATATDPYVEVTDLDHVTGDCDNTGCTYFLTATAWLHNPLSEKYSTSIKCDFWDDDYLIGDSVRAGISIDASRSKELQFQEQYTTADSFYFSTTCDLFL